MLGRYVTKEIIGIREAPYLHKLNDILNDRGLFDICMGYLRGRTALFNLWTAARAEAFESFNKMPLIEDDDR